MTPRTIHIGGSFAIVVVAYWAYALLAVPWIEPPPDRPDHGIVKDPGPPPVIDLRELFPEGSWQLHDAKIINNNGQGMLLWQKYVNGNNGWVDLSPMTVIFLSDENETDLRERVRHAIVMDVPEGADLHFDPPLDINKGGIGRLVEGRLRGPVTIRSQGKRPDHQDDLLVRTHDVDLSEQRITTANDVDFTWGLSSGRGRQMEIKLLPRLGPRVDNAQGPNIGGIEQIQFEHVERVHLDMGSAAAPAAKGGAPKPPTGGPLPGPLSAHAAPVEITCRGPFCFNLVDPQVATFRDQVDVQRIQPNAQADHMGCELLSIFFTRPAAPKGAAKPGKQTAPGFDLQPSRIEARGTPTTVTAPSDHLRVQAEQLKYNLSDGQIYLEDAQEVFVRKDGSEFHGPNLRYTPGPPNHNGQFQLLIVGPGRLQGEMADRPGQQFEAHWRQKLEAHPQDRNELISFSGGANLKFQAMGELNARDIHFWLHEAPPDAAGGGGFQPDRLLAEQNVVGDSPQFSLKNVERLEVWFAKAPAAPPSLPAGVAAAGVAAGASPPYVPSTAATLPLASFPSPSAAGPVARTAGPVLPFALGPQAPAASGRQAHLEVSGRLVQASVLLHEQQNGELTEVKIIDNVRLQETQTAQPDQRPLLVTGQWLHATEANSPKAKVTVTGEPAHMEGRGMSLTGPNIHIDRGANTLDAKGPGRMEKFLENDLDNRPLKHGETIKIDWQQGMTFDGRKAHFQDSVNVVGESKLLVTGWMDVLFQQPISLSDQRPQAQPKIAKLICGDGVFMENSTIEKGQRTSYDRMQFKNLELDHLTGDFHGDGPGWATSVRRGGGQGLSIPGGPIAGLGPSATTRPISFSPQQPQPSDPNQLICIRVIFMRSITGNELRKDLIFHGRVRAAYAPTQSWTETLKSDDPQQLGPEAAVLKCEQLEVNDMSPVSGSSGRNVELRAQDNVIAEGTNKTGTHFTIRSARFSYAEAKGMAVVEGDGRSDAELFTQEGGPGSAVSRYSAQKFLYFPKTNEKIVEGMHTNEMDLGPASPLPPPPRKK